jgi:superfamily II DNA or RNA helicase
MSAWIRGGALLTPPGARIDALVAKLGDTTAIRTLQGPHKGWTVLPRALPVPRGVTVVNKTICPYARTIRMKVTLRDYQAAAVAAWRVTNEGVIVAPCGAGKTVMGLACVANTATPALILVHRRDLADQWMERAKDQLGLAAELVTDSKTKARLAIATFQQLAAWSAEDLAKLGALYGLVVVDEAHHVPAGTFSAVLSALPGRHRLAITATPERLDGLTPLLYAHCGPQRAVVEITDLQARGATLVPEVRWLASTFNPARYDDAGLALTTHRGRNKLIVDTVVKEAAEGRRVLVLVNRVAHCAKLADLIRRAGVRAEHITGAPMPATDRTFRLDSLRAGTLSALVATSVADEGLDLPELDTVVLGVDTSAMGREQQRIGRALRPRAGKGTPRVYAVQDKGPGARERRKLREAMYMELGWTAGTTGAP